MKRRIRIWHSGLVAVALLLQACSTVPLARQEITLLAINDFHGNLQSEKPVPYLHHGHDDAHPEKPLLQPAGGYAYLATAVKALRAKSPDSLLVGAGDLIGASPLGSTLLKDEPVIEAMNQLKLDATSLGNHEFDIGKDALLKKIKGDCGASPCTFAAFHGANYPYLAANVFDSASGHLWMQPYVMREIAGVKIALIGAVTKDTPNIVAGNATQGLRFDDEADSVNKLIPEIKQQGASVIVLLIHEGAMYGGDANDSSYRCPGLNGPIIDIAKRLDSAVDVIVSGHSHQAYTCKIDGRLVTQARNYGAYVTEIKLLLDARTQHVIDSSAINHLVDQAKYARDPQAQQLVDAMSQATEAIRSRVITRLPHALLRKSNGRQDSLLGNVIADAQRAAVPDGQIAFTNAGGIRTDLGSAAEPGTIDVTFADIYSAQPFRNRLVRVEMTGAQIIAVLQQQWRQDGPYFLACSHGFQYTWRNDGEQHVLHATLDGQPLDPAKTYRVVLNSFLAGGGDGFGLFKSGTNQHFFGIDADALETYLQREGEKVMVTDVQRVRYAN